MTLTVRHRGQLLAADGHNLIDSVVAVIWFDPDEESGTWGGIIEPAQTGPELRARVAAGQDQYRLRLDDGREGPARLAISAFVADGAQPLTVSGLGALARQTLPPTGA